MSNHKRSPRRVTGHALYPVESGKRSGYSRLTVPLVALASVGCAPSEPRLVEPVGYTLTAAPAAPDAEQLLEPPKSQPKEKPPAASSGSIPFPWCTMPNSEGDALYFATNSFALEPESEDTLNHVADCMIRGSLQGRRVVVVGYADPRGGERYNTELALRRAEMARRYLVRLGVDPTHVALLSQGKRFAQGIGPESWYYDRRVEIRLVPES